VTDDREPGSRSGGPTLPSWTLTKLGFVRFWRILPVAPMAAFYREADLRHEN
jgi:hypothetical protein